jgi:hypothetical protein
MMAKAGIDNDPTALVKMRALSAADIWKLNGTALAWVGPDLGVLVDGYVVPRSPFPVFQEGVENVRGLRRRKRLSNETCANRSGSTYG